MGPNEVFIPILGILLVMIPVAGVTLILTMRFALKPFVETMAKALRDAGFSSSAELQVQIEDLSQQVQELNGQIDQLRQAHDFDRKLLGKSAESSTS